MGGYLRAKQEYGDNGSLAGIDEIVETHRYGGFLGGGEFGVKWRVHPRLRVGMRLSGGAGYLSHSYQATECGFEVSASGDIDYSKADCSCEYYTYYSGAISSVFVMDVVLFEWMWVDVMGGLLFPIDTEVEVSIGLIAGAGLGFSIFNNKMISPYLRLNFAVVTEGDLGIFPHAAAGIGF
jgi:hypothetical protein